MARRKRKKPLTVRQRIFYHYRKLALKKFKTYPLKTFLAKPELISKEPGLYVIYNIDKYHPYIGESVNVRRRLIQHATKEWPTQYVDREIKKLGPEHFRVGFITRVKEQKPRRKVESQYVQLLNAYYNGYNGSATGHPTTQFQRSAKKAGKKFFRSVAPKAYKRRNQNNRYQGWFSMFWFVHFK